MAARPDQRAADDRGQLGPAVPVRVLGKQRAVPDMGGVPQVEVAVAGEELDRHLHHVPVAAAADRGRRGGRADAGRVQPALGLQQRRAALLRRRRGVGEQPVGLAQQVELAER